ncbi:MAG: AraC family transcriptional regulator [Caldilineaceae bacterium]
MNAVTLIDPAPVTFGIHQHFDREFDSGWVQFPGHYLLYASTGAFSLTVGGVRWLLPPQRAAWLAAHTPMRLIATSVGTTSSVLFTEDAISALPFSCRVFVVTPLAREMLLHAMRWERTRDPNPALAANQRAAPFFRSLADLCLDLAAAPDEFWLPQAQSPELAAALDYTLAHLAATLTVVDVAAAVNVSARTLARRFADETGMTWRQYVRRARLIRAMELLADSNTKVINIAYAVGFSSLSAFNHAFRDFTGETPTSYRRRFTGKATLDSPD